MEEKKKRKTMADWRETEKEEMERWQGGWWREERTEGWRDGWSERILWLLVYERQLQSLTRTLSFFSSLAVTGLIHLQLNLLQAVCVCVCVCVSQKFWHKFSQDNNGIMSLWWITRSDENEQQ